MFLLKLNSVTKIFLTTVKGLEPATSCVRDQHATIYGKLLFKGA